MTNSELERAVEKRPRAWWKYPVYLALALVALSVLGVAATIIWQLGGEGY